MITNTDHPAEPVLACQDYCSWSPAGRSGTPRLGSLVATSQEPELSAAEFSFDAIAQRPSG